MKFSTVIVPVALMLVESVVSAGTKALEKDVFVSLDDLIQLKQQVADAGINDVPDVHDIFQRHLQDDGEGDENECEGILGSGECGPELTCMRLGIRKHCVPLDCLLDIAMDYKNNSLTDAYWHNMFATAGVTTDEITEAFASSPLYRNNPYELMGHDNAFRRFADTFVQNAPDYKPIMLRSMECIAKAPTIQGITPLFGVTYGGGAVLKFDFAFLWGNGSGDLDIENGSSFIPSAFFEFSLSAFAGANVDISGTFGWTFTGTKEDIPGSSLQWGARLHLGPGAAVEGSCDFPQVTPGVTVDAGVGLGGGFNLGWTYACMYFNGSQAITRTPSSSPSVAPSHAPTVTA